MCVADGLAVWLSGWPSCLFEARVEEGKTGRTAGQRAELSQLCRCRGPRVVIKIPGPRSRECISQCKATRCRSPRQGQCKGSQDKRQKERGNERAREAAGLRSTFSAA